MRENLNAKIITAMAELRSSLQGEPLNSQSSSDRGVFFSRTFQGRFRGPVSPAPVPSPTSQRIYLMGSLGSGTVEGRRQPPVSIETKVANGKRCWEISLRLRTQGRCLDKIIYPISLLIGRDCEEGISVAEISGGWRHSGQANSNRWKCTMSRAVFRGQARLSSEEGESKPTLHPHLMRDIWKGKIWSVLIGVLPGEQRTLLFQAMQVNIREWVNNSSPTSYPNYWEQLLFWFTEFYILRGNVFPLGHTKLSLVTTELMSHPVSANPMK